MNANRTTLVAAAVLACLTGGARADDPTPDPYTHMVMVSARTRADVVAELHAARASGELAMLNGEDSGSFQLAALRQAGTRTRAEVRAEVLAARQSGELDAMTGEDSGSFHLARANARQAPDSVRLAATAR